MKGVPEDMPAASAQPADPVLALDIAQVCHAAVCIPAEYLVTLLLHCVVNRLIVSCSSWSTESGWALHTSSQHRQTASDCDYIDRRTIQRQRHHHQ